MSKMMRISEVAAKQLDDLIEVTGQSRQKILEAALQAFAKHLFFKKNDVQYKALKKDKAAWNEFAKEMAEWDVTLNDGLEDE